MRSQPSVLHLDLDAFFASVEQRDKPSLRGKPVIVGGVGARGVVATASYEARVFGVHSAMPGHEAKRRCPNGAFLAGRHEIYRVASRQVMTVLRDLSPLVEPLSLDEAFVDLNAARRPVDLSPAGLARLVAEIKSDVATATGGLTASIGIGSSKFIAKVATELGKPDGYHIVPVGTEVAMLAPMSAKVIPGVGPVTFDKLRRIGIETVADLQRVELIDVVQVIGRSHGIGLKELAFARDDRAVEPEREAKSISVEDTFGTDLVDTTQMAEILDRDARQVAARLSTAQLLARTVTIKVRLHGFITHTRSRTLTGGTDRPDLISQLARSLLGEVDTTPGVRLLGVGVAGLTDVLQDDLFAGDPEIVPISPGDDGVEAAAQAKDIAEDIADDVAGVMGSPVPEADPAKVTVHRAARSAGWPPGADVEHDEHGRGWVWGAGRGVVTVRFETAETPPGPVRTFRDDDPALRRI